VKKKGETLKKMQDEKKNAFSLARVNSFIYLCRRIGF